MNYREMTKVFFVSFLVIGVNEIILFSAIALVSHELSQKAFGNFQSFVASMNFFGGLITFGFSAFMAKYLPVLQHKVRFYEWREIKSYYLKFIFPITLIILGLLTIFFLALFSIFRSDGINHPFLLMCFVTLLEASFFLAFTYLKAQSKYILATTLYFIKNASFLLMVIFLKYLLESIYIVIICYLMAYILTIIYFFIIKHLNKKQNEKNQKLLEININPVKWKILIFPFALLAISPYLFSALVMIIFEVFSSGSENLVGQFGVIMALFNVSLIAIFPLKTFTVNELSKVIDIKEKIPQTMKVLFIFSLITSVILCLVFNLFATTLIKFMSHQYHDLLSYFRVILLLLVLIGVTNPFSSCLKVSHHAHYPIICIILTTMVSICVFGGILAYFYQIRGMLTAVFLVYFIYACLNIYFFYRLHIKH